jgi:hypothetical protein
MFIEDNFFISSLPHDQGHEFSMLTQIDSRLLHHFIYMSNFILIFLIVFLSLFKLFF